MTFFIALFILLMQFLWKYVDDLVGKGLEWYIIGELLFYASATFVPLALPLAILLSSIMTMGSLGENYELVALKSAGISLTRIMWPLIVISSIFVFAAFYFSNNVLPVANLKMGSLLYDVRQQRPAFNIMEGIYYKGIDNFVIRVEEKDGDGSILRNIKIYDHTERRGNTNVTLAEWGTMNMTEDKMYLVFTLYNGSNYQEIEPRDSRDRSQPFQRTHFEEQVRRFDLSGFALARTDEELFRSNFRMLNISQLLHFEDSLSTLIKGRQKDFIDNSFAKLYFYNSLDSEGKAALDTIEDFKLPDLWDIERANHRKIAAEVAMNNVRQLKESALFNHEDIRTRRRGLARYQIEFHRKFTLSFACLVLFMIGAPLGAIIRKGGFGLPVVVSVLFFVLFHVLSITGEKFVREGVLEPWQGMWMSILFFLPIAILLIIQATTDSSLMDMDSYLAKIARFKAKGFLFGKKRKLQNEDSSVNQ
ncbi:MAG: YjgP/YjgQ family permease [Bacteroidetes bacterium]|nr:MAG: YjgP/YjgQ family permease [Bacteroidota bacterium]